MILAITVLLGIAALLVGALIWSATPAAGEPLPRRDARRRRDRDQILADGDGSMEIGRGAGADADASGADGGDGGD